MTIRCALLFAVCGSVSSGVAAPGAKVVSADPMRLLPTSSRHVFRAAPLTWTKKTDYLHLQNNKAAFIVLDASERPNLKTDWRDVVYFDNPKETDRNNFRKVLRFHPDGSLALEIDCSAPEQFDRSFARDGTVVSYEYLRDRKRIAGYNLDPNTKKLSHFSGGHGDWIEWHEGGRDFTHNWVHDGDFYLVKSSKSGNILTTKLIVAGMGDLQLSPTGEKLNLFSMHEHWQKSGDQPVSAQISDYHINGKDASIVKDSFPDDEIKRHIRALHRPMISRRMDEPHERDPLLQGQLETDYLLRRARFLSSLKRF